MNSFKNHIIQREDMLWEMANFRAKDTNLSMNIFVSTNESEGKILKHGPRIKVARTYSNKFTPFDTFSLTIEKDPKVIGDIGEIKTKDIKLAKEFIRINYDALLAYWDGEYSTADLIGNVQKV